MRNEEKPDLGVVFSLYFSQHPGAGAIRTKAPLNEHLRLLSIDPGDVHHCPEVHCQRQRKVLAAPRTHFHSRPGLGAPLVLLDKAQHGSGFDLLLGGVQLSSHSMACPALCCPQKPGWKAAALVMLPHSFSSWIGRASGLKYWRRGLYYSSDHHGDPSEKITDWDFILILLIGSTAC